MTQSLSIYYQVASFLNDVLLSERLSRRSLYASYFFNSFSVMASTWLMDTGNIAMSSQGQGHIKIKWDKLHFVSIFMSYSGLCTVSIERPTEGLLVSVYGHFMKWQNSGLYGITRTRSPQSHIKVKAISNEKNAISTRIVIYVWSSSWAFNWKVFYCIIWTSARHLLFDDYACAMRRVVFLSFSRSSLNLNLPLDSHLKKKTNHA